jgi:hypothetical protein
VADEMQEQCKNYLQIVLCIVLQDIKILATMLLALAFGVKVLIEKHSS